MFFYTFASLNKKAMYTILLLLHSLFRWLVLASLAYSIYRACRGYMRNSTFTQTDNAVRHWTATIAHTQLLIGMVLYFKSPLIQYFWTHQQKASLAKELSFFSIIHILLMFASILIITIGSALAKRQTRDRVAFRTILISYSIALVLILIVVPWPFSPLANRPYFR
ncbi:hypothetical protein [Niabella hibiscisoli]|uniref:hypothetical protein n=1 Tax=Niabella hibiscisoli TaxID=1825928 RepID=UPI001F10BF4C|nr:hypothetical protein [Niabella hibiscisoli]MCH5718505.1 hypothetical protein [Niabella hibiscisoli]